MSRHWILALLIFVFSAWSPTPTFPQSSPREAANYTACLYGNSFGCNPSLLTDVQRSQVQRAALQRNYTACVYGNDFGCNKSLLTTTQQADVQRAVTSPGASAEVWEKVIARLRAGSMPPPGRPRPDKATYHAVASALEDNIDRAWSANPNPGRINAVHRLNRAEYNNAIRDLFALDIDVKPLLPGDETADGSFDNLADALSIATAHLERTIGNISGCRELTETYVSLSCTPTRPNA